MIEENVKGFWLEGDSARKIWSGDVSAILKEKHYRFAIGGEYYLVDNTACYGLIKLIDVNKVQPSEFHDLFDKHGVDNIERVVRWKTANKIIYMYNFEFVNKFDDPYKILIPLQPSSFVDNFIVLNEIVDNEIVLKDEYIVKNLSDESLNNDWKKVLNWYLSVKEGEKIMYSEETIVNFMSYLYDELISRNILLDVHEVPKKCKGLFHELSNNVCYKIELFNGQLINKDEDLNLISQFEDLDKLSLTLFSEVN